MYCVMTFQNSALYAFDLRKNITYPQKNASINFNIGMPSFKNNVYITPNSVAFLTETLPIFKEGRKNNPIIKIITLSNELSVLNETRRTIEYMMENSYDNPFIDISNVSDSTCYALLNSRGKYRQIYSISLRSHTIDIINIPNSGIVPYFYGIEKGSGTGFYLYGSLNSNFFISNYNNIGKQIYTSRYNIREQIQKIYGITLFKNRVFCALDTTKNNNNETFKLCVCNKNDIVEELEFEGKEVSLFPYYNDFLLCSYKRAGNLEFILLNEKNMIQETFKVENVEGLVDYKIVEFDKNLYLFMLYKERINLYELDGQAFRLIETKALDGFYSTIGFAIINKDTCFVGLGYPVYIKKTNLVQHEIAILKFQR